MPTAPASTPQKRGRKPLVRDPEPRPDLTKEEMREKLIGIKEIESVTGIRYIRLHVTAKMIIGIRKARERNSPSISTNSIKPIPSATTSQVRR